MHSTLDLFVCLASDKGMTRGSSSIKLPLFFCRSFWVKIRCGFGRTYENTSLPLLADFPTKNPRQKLHLRLKKSETIRCGFGRTYENTSLGRFVYFSAQNPRQKLCLRLLSKNCILYSFLKNGNLYATIII